MGVQRKGILIEMVERLVFEIHHKIHSIGLVWQIDILHQVLTPLLGDTCCQGIAVHGTDITEHGCFS